MYDFSKAVQRRGTESIKWDVTEPFGVDKPLLPFWIADMDFETLPEVSAAINKRCEHPIFGYSFTPESCLEAVSGWYERRHGFSCEPSQMTASIGVVTALRFSIEAVTQPGDKALVFTPVYNPLPEIIHNTGRTLVELELLESEGRYAIDFGALENAFKNGVRAVVFCNPHNPIGKVWTWDELSQLAGLCARYGVYLLSDEVHGDIVTGDIPYTTLGRFSGVHSRIAVYTAISKTFNLAGLQASCILAPDKALRERIDRELKKAWIMGPNPIATAAMEAAYNYGDKWVDELNSYLKANLRFAEEYLLQNAPAVRLFSHEGTYLLWMDWTALKIPSDEMTHILARDYGIGVGSGAPYGSQAEGYLRFNFGCTRAVLESGLNALGQFYNDHLGSR